MTLKRILIAAPVLLLAALLQSWFWVPTYQNQTSGNPARVEKFIDATIGDASFLNPVISADNTSSQIIALVFDALLRLDENLVLRGDLAEAWTVTETALLVADPAGSFPDGVPVTAERLRERIQRHLGSQANAVRILPPERRLETVTLPHPVAEASDPRPASVEVALELPARIAIDLPQVVPDVFERLGPVVGEDYFDRFQAERHVHLPEGPAGEVVRSRLAELVPAREHNPVLTFRLRRGVQFHDGHEFDAGDVRFTYQAVMDPKNLSPRTADFEEIKAIEVLDRYTVRVVYRRLFSPAVYAWSAMRIVPEHRLNDASLAREAERRGVPEAARASFGLRQSELSRAPVGTGPFRFVEWQSDHLIHLARFDDHWDGPAEYADYFLRVVPDYLTQEVEFRSGALDMYPALPHQAARYREDPAYQSFSSIGFGYTYIGYNLRHELFREARVRRALGMAIDVDQIIRYVLYGEGERVTGPYPIATEWYDPSVAPLPYDPEGALAILNELGWRRNAEGWLEKDGRIFEFTLITNNGNPLRKAVITIAQNAWRKLGIKCETQLFEWAVFLKDFVDTREFDALVLGWTNRVDPDLYQIWHSSQTGASQLNFAGYQNAEADALIEATRREYDRDRQRQLAHRLHARIAEDQPYTFLYAARGTRVVDRKIVMIEREDGREQMVPIRPAPSNQLLYSLFLDRWTKLDHVPEF